jgi:hypothetical protein
MKKTLIFVLLLLSLFAYKVNAAPNNGALPENGVKVNFNEDGTYSSIEGSGWAFNQLSGSLTLTKGDVVITLNEYVFKNGEEIIGFSWMIEGATAVLWVKHGTSQIEYGNGTSGEFVTNNNKGVSNAVFLIEIVEDDEEETIDEEENDDEEEIVDEEEDNDDEEEIVDEEEDNDDEEEIVDEEEVVDEEEDNDDEEEVVDEEDDNDDEEEIVNEEEDDDEVLGDDEENEEENVEEENEEENVDEEDEVLGEDEESLPDTSDASRGFGLMIGLLGLIMLVVSRKKAVA